MSVFLGVYMFGFKSSRLLLFASIVFQHRTAVREHLELGCNPSAAALRLVMATDGLELP
jgi:hypothetical protein